MKNLKIWLLFTLTITLFACGGKNEQQIKENKSAEEAISALKKTDAATDVGINKLDYSRMLIDTLSTVNQASEKLPDSELKQEIKSAMDAFMDAKTLWNIMGEDTTFYACEKQPDTSKEDTIMKGFLELSCNPEGGNLMRKYKIPLHPYPKQQTIEDGKGVIEKKEGVAIIWKKAKEHIDRASTLYKGLE